MAVESVTLVFEIEDCAVLGGDFGGFGGAGGVAHSW